MAEEYVQQLILIHRKLDKIMTALDDLNAAVATLTTSINSEIAALTAAQANNDDAGVEAAVANLNALNTQLQNSLTPTTVAPTTTATAEVAK